MRQLIVVGLVVTTLLAAARGQDRPEMPAPAKEHAWLKQFVGEWESEAEMTMEPGKPPIKAKGFETNRMLGGFWIVSEGKSEVMGTSIHVILTLGYDTEKKKYVGTWVDSMTSYLWKYEGSLDAAGKALTLETQGPLPTAPGKMSNFREVHEFKGPDHRTFTAYILGDDGKWTTMVTVNTRRKK